MKIKEFNYIKKNGEKSHRKVMIINNHTEYIDVIDLDKLESEEIKLVIEAQQEYETKLEPFMKKSFRRFNKSGMTDIIFNEEK